VSWPSVSICVEFVNEATCSGGTVYAVPPFEVSGSAWVKYDASSAGGCSGSSTFKPAVELLATDYLQSVDLSSLVCSDQPASAFVFGVGGLSPPFDISQLDTTQVAGAFAAGFVLVGMFWALGKAVGMLMGMVRR
jgi:hypothetical protein